MKICVIARPETDEPVLKAYAVEGSWYSILDPGYQLALEMVKRWHPVYYSFTHRNSGARRLDEEVEELQEMSDHRFENGHDLSIALRDGDELTTYYIYNDQSSAVLHLSRLLLRSNYELDPDIKCAVGDIFDTEMKTVEEL